MYERMLNKQEEPTFEDLIRFCGDSGALWLTLDEYLQTEFDSSKLIRFPYGNKYGWSAKYSRKNKHICDVFAENGAFTVKFQISSDSVDSVSNEMDDYAKAVWANKYPCSSGGWVDFRILNSEQLESAKVLLRAKMTPRSRKRELSK